MKLETPKVDKAKVSKTPGKLDGFLSKFLCFKKKEEDFSNILPATGEYKTDAKIKQMQAKITRIIK